MKRSLTASVFIPALVFALASAAPPAVAEDADSAVEIPVKKQSGINYVSGGMNDAEKKAMHKVANKYPMQLVFTGPDASRELEGVKITVTDLRGDKIIEAQAQGPWFYFNPPSGRYTMKAEYQGETVERTVDLVGRRYIVLEFHFGGEKG